MTTTSFPIELDIEGLEIEEVRINREGHYGTGVVEWDYF